MRTYVIVAIALIATALSSCSRSTAGVYIEPNQEFILGEDTKQAFKATLKNDSTFDIKVSVRDTETGEQTQGFGLAGNGKVDVYISRNEEVHLINEADAEGKVTVHLNKTVQGMRYEGIE